MPPIHFCETFLAARDHTPLFTRSAVLGQNAKASVLLTHGMGEHSARYFHVADFFAKHGYRLCAYDLRGHGRSGGRRGHLDRYEDLLDDLEIVMNQHAHEGALLFLYGHSLGGQITLNFLQQRRPAVRGAVITSPWLQLVFQPAPWKILLARIALTFWPTFTQNGPDDPSQLSRDADFLASMSDPELMHHKMSARMFNELQRGARQASAEACLCGYPLLLSHGAEDALTSAQATESFFKDVASSDKTLKIYPAMRHETHNEIGRETVLADIVEWLDKRCP